MKLPITVKQKGSYEIFIVKTGEVVDTCRLKATANNRLSALREETKEELGVKKVK